MKPARDSWVNPALALCACAATGATFAWLKLPLPWMIGPLATMALCNFAGASLRAPRGGRENGESRAAAQPAALDPLWARAQAQVPGWRTVALRIPASPAAPVVFNIDKGDGGQPHLRSTLTLDARSGDVLTHETFADLTLERRIRNTMRFAHTGEVLGIPGQTIAGIVSAGGAVLVWTGIALAWRRLRAWMGRRDRQSSSSRVENAA